MAARHLRRWLFLAASVAASALGVDAIAPPAAANAEEPRAARRASDRPLKVRRLKPRNGRTFVPLDAEITARFSRPIDPATVNAQTVTFRKVSGELVAWSFRLEKGDRTLVLVPTAPFEPGRDYEALLHPGITSVDGRTLRRDARTIFFTDSRFPPFLLLRPDQFEALEARMQEGRAAHSATLIAQGRVLLAGGYSDAVALARGGELYVPSQQRFLPATTLLRTPRAFHPAVELDGSALLIGGYDGTTSLASTELFNSGTLGFQPGPSMAEERDFHAAVFLQDGRVLVTGGLHYGTGGAVYSRTAEILELDGTFRLSAGAPIRARAGHTLTVLPDGRVLVAGGIAAGSNLPSTAEIFDPATETFREVSQATAYYRQLHTATLLDDPRGLVLLADGGSAVLEIYDPTTDRFYDAGGASFVHRTRATSTLIPGGMVLLAGGFEQRGTETLLLRGVNVFVEGQGDRGHVVRSNVVFADPRAGHTATTLADGRVLFAGGFSPNAGDSLDTAVLFTPDPAGE